MFRQSGYSIADILAKAAFGLVIFKIAKAPHCGRWDWVGTLGSSADRAC